MMTNLRNNKRKFWTLVISLGLVAALAVGITIAWFSDTQTMTNVATVAGVDITLDENVTDATLVTGEVLNPYYVGTAPISPTNPHYTVTDPEGGTVPSPLLPGTYTEGVGATYAIGLPGASYVKMPTVTNEDQPVFLRLVVSRTWGAMTPAGDISKIILHLVNASEWTHVSSADVNGDGVIDDVFYYNSILVAPNETSAPFDYFTISNTVGNAYVNVPANVGIKAEALQASGLSGSYATANLIPETLWDSVQVAP